MAVSANGMIADEHYGEDFLSHANWETFSGLVKKYKNFVVGRKTLEAVKNWGTDYGFDDFTEATKVILSRGLTYELPAGYISATSPQSALTVLENKGFTNVLVSGGASVNTAFAKAGLLDEIILNIEPVIVAGGLSIFDRGIFLLRLELLKTTKINDSIVQLYYRVIK